MLKAKDLTLISLLESFTDLQIITSMNGLITSKHYTNQLSVQRKVTSYLVGISTSTS